ncbi:hypothetical protein CEXT_346831 [Caerostris extrusa]|uniref:Uncharacterized protein n=1 Tax=Caerostris extrusa TaxID=172846 RepID=A0AAV4SYB5_CAEEX|nr:hypothetical protein CEXT_346831 [Caerostris extrusa]
MVSGARREEIATSQLGKNELNIYVSGGTQILSLSSPFVEEPPSFLLKSTFPGRKFPKKLCSSPKVAKRLTS